MADYLAEWISERPYLIEQMKKHPSLESMLRRFPLKRNRQPAEEDKWQQIVNQLLE